VDPQRQREVVEREHRAQPAAARAAQHPAVVAHGGPVGQEVQAAQLGRRHPRAGGDGRRRAREDAAPLDPQADRVVVKPAAGQVEVLAVAPPRARPALDPVAADGALADQRRVMGERPPVAGAVGERRRPARLDLEAGSRRAPHEAVGEALCGGCTGTVGRCEHGEARDEDQAQAGHGARFCPSRNARATYVLAGDRSMRRSVRVSRGISPSASTSAVSAPPVTSTLSGLVASATGPATRKPTGSSASEPIQS
jgi:hypothetical protein